MGYVAGEAFPFLHGIVDNRSCKLILLAFMTCITECNPFLFQKPLVGAGMGIVTFPAGALLVLEMLNRLVENVFFLIMAGGTERGIDTFQLEYL